MNQGQAIAAKPTDIPESADALPAERPEVVRHNLRRSMQDCASFGVMVGMGETYLPAFALAVGMSETTSGLVASLPVVAGGAMQLASLWAMRWFRDEQRWVVVCAFVQAVAFLPLVIAALIGSIRLPMLMMIASVYWASGLASGPAWNTWMESVVPPSLRARYFSKRSRLQQASTLLGLLAAGGLLQVAKANDTVLLGFAAIFIAAGIARIVSAVSLADHRSDRRLSDRAAARLSSFGTTAMSRSGRRLLIYLVATQACVQVSGPFFAPFMLEQLQFSYLQYVGLMAVAFVSRVVAMSQWTRIASHFGSSTLLWMGAFGLVPLSSLWMVSDNLYYLVLVQAISGIAWAAYELGFFLLFFETLPANRRTRMLTYYNFANTLAMCGGALLGAALLGHFGCNKTGYYVLFGLSGIGRVFALLLLLRANLKPVPIHRVAVRILGLRPATGPLDVPILSSLNKGSDANAKPSSQRSG